jgi:hypothetical protein
MSGPPERLAALQKRFADHIRDPDRYPAPEGIEARRLAIYRRLFFNNLSSLFAKNFSIVRRVVPDERWRELIAAFLAEHRSTTPLFPEIGREFVRFLAEHPERHREWPWLAELAHWQFLNTTVRNAEDDPANVAADPDGDLITGRPRLNPTMQLAAYRWPVHAIRADRPAPAAASTVLAVWRNADDRLERFQINAVTARLLDIVKEDPACTGRLALERIAAELDHRDPATLIEHGRTLLTDLQARGLILGSAPD